MKKFKKPTYPHFLWITCGKLCGKGGKGVEIPLFLQGLNIFYASKKCSILWNLNFEKCGFFLQKTDEEKGFSIPRLCV